jgi:hypothetical protein
VGGYTTTGSSTTGSSTPGTTGLSSTTGGSGLSGTTGVGGSKTEAAKEATRETAETAKGEAQHLAQSAKDELGNVTSTATDQMRRLMDQSRSELTDQARSQQQRLSTNLRTLTDELESMARQGDQQGVAHDLVRQVSQQARTLGDWLDGNEPGAVLDEVKRFARRKPGTFLAVAAGLGFLSGRMTRGLAAAAKDEDTQSFGSTGYRADATGYTAYGTPAYPATTGTTEPVLDGPLATTGTTAAYPTTPTGATSATGSTPVGTYGTSDPLGSDEGTREEWTDRGDAR